MKNFWERRMMWVWCFDNWLNLMQPQRTIRNYNNLNSEEQNVVKECNNHMFWLFLNNYNQLFGTNDSFQEDD